MVLESVCERNLCSFPVFIKLRKDLIMPTIRTEMSMKENKLQGRELTDFNKPQVQ